MRESNRAEPPARAQPAFVALLRLSARRLLTATVFVPALTSPLLAAAIDWGRAVVDTTMRRYPDPADFGYWNYSYAFQLYGHYLVYKRTGERRYLNYIIDWVNAHIDSEGSIDQPIDELDKRMPGLLPLILYRETGELRYKSAAEKIRRAFDTHPRTSDGGFWHVTGERWWRLWDYNKTDGKLWADGAFMAVPFLVEYGLTFPDSGAGADEAVRQLLVYARHLQDPATGLLYHVYDETGQASWLAPGTSHSREFWCRAIGWYGMALIYTVDRLGDHPRRPELLAVLERLVPALERYQDPHSGRWFQVVDKGLLSANWTETSCSAMHTFVLWRAVRGGYVPSHHSHADAAVRGYRGVLDMISLDAQGMVNLEATSKGTHVGDIDYYLARPRLANWPHGLGAFLLMYEHFPNRAEASTE